jgi:hypothetical protein
MGGGHNLKIIPETSAQLCAGLGPLYQGEKGSRPINSTGATMNYLLSIAATDPAPAIDQHFKIATHNGCITAYNPATGQHRTFKITTQADDAKFAPGQRIVSLLSGQDNEGDYRGFGFVVDGQVVLWRKYQDSASFRWYRRFLNNPAAYPVVEVNYEGRCRKCDRLLTTPESCALGIGPVCAGKE